MMRSPQWNAADYATHSRGQFNWAMSVIDRLALRGSERVLDVGCGDGKVSAEIAARVPRGRVVGVDQSAAMIDLAVRTWSTRANLSFRAVDAQALDFPPLFDLAFSNAAIHWMPDFRAVAAGLARGLAPGGRVFLSMGGRGTAALVFASLEALRTDARWAGLPRMARMPYHFRGPEDVEPALEAAGFRPARVELVAKPIQHADRSALTGWLRTTWMWCTEQIPESHRDEFLDALSREVASGCGRGADGALLLPMVNLEIEASLISKDR